MPRRFVSVTVSRLRSHTLHLQVREASWLSLSRSFAVDHKTREPQGRVPVPRKPHCHRCHRHRCHRWREPLVHTRQPRFYGVIVGVGNGGGSVVCCNFSYYSSSRMCGGVAWDWSVPLQGAGGRWRGECCVFGSENFFPGQRKNVPWAGNKFSRSAGANFPLVQGTHPV